MRSSKKPPKIISRNHAVQAVGETYFRVALLGIAAAGILGIVAVSIGSARGMFEFRLDRCNCLLTSGAQNAVDEGQNCVFGEDMLGVNIGWKSFVIDHAVSTEGCLDGWEGTTDIGSPFGDGIYRKKTEVYGNGATGAADACVGLFVVSAAIAFVMYKTVKMSYSGPGSIYSIGLHNIAMVCLLLSIGSAISVMAFWGRVQGKLGTLSNSLAATLFKATLDVCQDDWDTVGFPIDGEEFCQVAPWTFDVPLYAGWTAIAHVSVMFLTSVWILSRSALVEGMLDGSKLASGKAVTPRVVEFENAVGRALATTEDPDYDVPDNKLYTGEQKIMIRPYPLPGSVKAKVAKAGEALVSPLRNMLVLNLCPPNQTQNRNLSPPGLAEEEYMLHSGSTGSGAGFNAGQGLPSPGPVRPIPKSPPSKVRRWAGERTARRPLPEGGMPGRAAAPCVEYTLCRTQRSRPGLPSGKDQRARGEVPTHQEVTLSSFGPIPIENAGARHGKTRSEIDWDSIMEAGGSGDGSTIAGKSYQDVKGDGSPHLSPSMLEDLDTMFHGPSVKDGLTLGAITEDPREDMISEFTITPRKKGSATQFEV
ncbi:unnamed protein product [Scytosiphon promiscuus]